MSGEMANGVAGHGFSVRRGNNICLTPPTSVVPRLPATGNSRRISRPGKGVFAAPAPRPQAARATARRAMWPALAEPQRASRAVRGVSESTARRAMKNKDARS